MALLYTQRLAEACSGTPGDTTMVSTSSFSATAGSTVVIQVACGGFYYPTSFTSLTGAPITGATLLYDAVEFYNSAGYHETTGLYVATATGSSGTITLTYPDVDPVGSNTPQNGSFLAIEVVPQVTVVQSARAQTTAGNSTATVTLSSSVGTGTECLYLAVWDGSTDDATPGSGWTEISDAAAGSNRVYAQYEPTPSGSQNGQVSGIASHPNASYILELREVGFTGWGIPIR